MWPKTNPNTQQAVGLSSKGVNVGVRLGPPKTNFNITKGTTMEQRRQLGLCYKCGDRYRGH